MPRRACLAIGVGSVVPPEGEASRFANLDGAIEAADAIGRWAIQSGFGNANVQTVTDRPGANHMPRPVTEERVQAAVDAIYPTGAAEVDHLVLSFCGHGLTDAHVGSMFWLFSDALEQGYKVNVDAFIAELLTYGVKRISLISDACRDAPGDLDLMRLEARRAIRRRSNKNVKSPMFDRLSACQDGRKSYMVVDMTSARPGKCILSGVALDVLWGLEPDAFQNDVLDTIRFGSFTRRRASERAAEYRLQLDPQCFVDPEPALLVDRRTPDPMAPAPALQPWPTVQQTTSMGLSEKEGLSLAPGLEQESFELLHANEKFRHDILGAEFGISHPDIDPLAEFGGLPDDARDLVKDLALLRRLMRAADPADIEGWAPLQIESTVRSLEGKAANRLRSVAAQALQARLVTLARPAPGSPFNLIVTGGVVRQLWSSRPAESVSMTGQDAQFGIKLSDTDRAAHVLVEFDDGLFAPVILYRDIYAVVARNGNGIEAVAHGGTEELFVQSMAAIVDLTAGTLNAADIDSIAARIREGKHNNPVLGAIAAHLYRAVSDLDSIRRMAFYYTINNQAVPFDIALLGEMMVEKDANNGQYVVRIPAVEQRRDVDAHNPLPRYVTTATPESIGQIGGACPWLTIGWDYPPAEQFGDKSYMGQLEGLSRPSNFTAIRPPFGSHLAERLKLTRRL